MKLLYLNKWFTKNEVINMKEEKSTCRNIFAAVQDIQI